MSLALIQESAKEVRRLAVAGSPLAVGDFRLKKFIAPLEQAGAQVPVFAQVAKAIGNVVNGTEAASPVNLLALSTLLNAILYTQGQSGADGDYRGLEIFPSNCSCTRTTARALKPLVQALTTTGGGRFETVKSACDRGAFNDLRLIDPAIQALGDNYPELADLVAEKILPAYGPGIVPRLKATLELKGKKQDARKLMVMHQLDPAGTLELCKKALEEGSAEVKSAAVTCLGQHEECLPLVIEQAEAKNKLVRAAALEALAAHDRPEITKLFMGLIQGKALDMLAGPFRKLRNKQVLDSLLEEGRRVFEPLAKGDAEQISRFWELLTCLSSRKEPEVEEFLVGCFANIGKIVKLKAPKNLVFGGSDLATYLGTMLYNVGTPRSLATILANRETLPADSFAQVFRAALRSWPPDKVFTEFSPSLDKKKGAGKDKANEIYRTMCASALSGIALCYDEDLADPGAVEAAGTLKVEWDSRWLDAAIKSEETMMVCWLAKPNHKGATTYLLKQLSGRNQDNANLIVQCLARCNYPKLTDCFIEQVGARTKKAQHYDWELQQLFAGAEFLPPADLPKLDAFAATLDEKFVDKFLEALGPLRTASQAAPA